MDKLRNFLRLLKKYHFWILSGIVLVTTLACWWSATAGLAEQFLSRRLKIEGDFNGVIIRANHPNQGVIDDVRKKDVELKGNVLGAWDMLYAQQKEKNPIPVVLDPDFKRSFESLKPKEELAREDRELYQDYILDHFPTLLKMVDVRRPADEEGEGATNGEAGKQGSVRRRGLEGGSGRGSLLERLGRRGREGPMPGMAMDSAPGMPGRFGVVEQKWIGVVEWADEDFQKLVNRFDWRATPTTMEVVLGQEDLWVYEALLRIIRNTNGKATNPGNAVVGQIYALEIGLDAAEALRQLEENVFRMPRTGDRGPVNARRLMGGSRAGRVGGAAAQQEQILKDLMDGRYVDDKGEPLAFESEYPYAKHPYPQFKMMPIHMSLEMDQRALPRLLVECANSNMPIEVHRVCIMTTSDQPLDLQTMSEEGGAGARMRGMGEGGPTGPSRPPRPGRMRGAGRGVSLGDSAGAEGATDIQDLRPFDVPVEIFGVIYIYNPPARDKLGMTAAAAEPPGGAAAPLQTKTPTPSTLIPAVPPPAAAAAPGKSSEPPPTGPAAPAGGSATPPAGPPSPPRTGSEP